MRAWLFQANPARWRIFDHVRDHPESLGRSWNWSCWRYRDEVHPGDRAVLWVSGIPRVRGVYAVGSVVGEPYVDVEDNDYWTDPADRRRSRWFVDMLFDRWLLDDPVLAVDLYTDPRFAGASITRTPRFANPHRLTEQQWDAIQDRLP